MIAAIVAVDQNWAIGCNNGLLVNLPEDMKFFRERTTAKKNPEFESVVICGRKTYESIPKRPLKDRRNIVITGREAKEEVQERPEAEEFVSLSGVKRWLESYEDADYDVFIIGGGQIYKALLPYCEKVYVTKIEASFEADTYYPNLDQDSAFLLTKEGERKRQGDLVYYFNEYERRKDGNAG